jgi:hypothetical protein
MSSDEPAPAPAAPPQGEETLEQQELHEERHIAGSPHAVAAGAALLALTRAARSFTLYDPANKVVRALIADYRDRFRAVLGGHGALALDVHPFELTLGREVVYLERDRERSLAFRLFRDGVRRLSFAAETSWDELLRLLQILSIRYTGVRQQEDDLVTLLRKAGFDSVQVAAIEGFVPEEEHAESPLEADLLRGARERYDPPAQWDQPPPPFPEAAPLLYRPVSEGLLARLRAEEAEDTIPTQALRAVSELLQAPGQPDLPAVLGFALEVREYLLVEGRTDLVVELARRVCAFLGVTTDATGAFLESWLDARTLAALVGALHPDASEIPAPFAELLDLAPPAAIDRVFDLLAAEADGPRAPLLRTILARSCQHAPQALVARLRGVQGAAAVALFRLLESIDPQAAHHAAMEATTGADAALQPGRPGVQPRGGPRAAPPGGVVPRERAARGPPRDGRPRRATRLHGPARPRRQARRAARPGRGRGGRPGAHAVLGAGRAADLRSLAAPEGRGAAGQAGEDARSAAPPMGRARGPATAGRPGSHVAARAPGRPRGRHAAPRSRSCPRVTTARSRRSPWMTGRRD